MLDVMSLPPKKANLAKTTSRMLSVLASISLVILTIIATHNIDQKLHIFSSLFPDAPVLAQTSTLPPNKISVSGLSAGNVLGTSTSTSWQDINGNVYISGRVGVGNTNPATAMDVSGYTNSSSGFCIGTTNCISAWPVSAAGTVTSIATGNGLTGGPITGSGTISLANEAFVPIGGLWYPGCNGFCPSSNTPLGPVFTYNRSKYAGSSAHIEVAWWYNAHEYNPSNNYAKIGFQDTTAGTTIASWETSTSQTDGYRHNTSAAGPYWSYNSTADVTLTNGHSYQLQVLTSQDADGNYGIGTYYANLRIP